MDGLEGRFFDGQTSRAVTARLIADGVLFKIVLEEDGRILTWGRDVTHISDPVPGVAVRFTFPDNGMFEASHDSQTKEFLRRSGFRTSVARLYSQRPKLVGATLVIAFGLPVLIFFFGARALDQVAFALPDPVVQTIGEQSYDQFTVFFETNAAGLPGHRISELEHLFMLTKEAARLETAAAHLVILDIPAIGANAIAFPHGTVVLTEELVELAASDDEIIAVLAHEIAHVQERHGLRAVVRSIGITVLITVVLGDAGFIEEIAGVGGGLLALAYSRDHELEADQIAGAILRRMDRDPLALISLLRRIQEGCGEACDETSLLSTHPGLLDRLDAVKQGASLE